jgi:hypothetical protein
VNKWERYIHAQSARLTMEIDVLNDGRLEYELCSARPINEPKVNQYTCEECDFVLAHSQKELKKLISSIEEEK